MVQLESILDINKDISQESLHGETTESQIQEIKDVKQTKLENFNDERRFINHSELNLMSPSQLSKIPLTASTPNRKSADTSICNNEIPLDNAARFESNNDTYLDEDQDVKSYENSTRSLDEDNTENIDASELKKESIPQIDESMTPWKNQDINKEAHSPNFIAYDLNKPDLGSTTFDTRPINFKSLITPNELEGLQNQLKKYKIKISALEEVIKGINESGSDKLKINELNNSLLDNFFNKINQISTSIQDSSNDSNSNMDKHYSDKINELNRENQKLRMKLTETQRELKDLKNEYRDTLQMTDEHLKDYERMTVIINSMLEDLIVTMKEDFDPNQFYDIIPILEDTMQQESSFVMNKLLQFQKYWLEIIISPKLQQRNILPIDESIGPSEEETNNTIENLNVDKQPKTTIDNKRGNINTQTKLHSETTSIIEELHKQYEEYMVTVRKKLRKSLTLQDKLISKISEQDECLTQLSSIIKGYKKDSEENIKIEDINTIKKSIENLAYKFDKQSEMSRTKLKESIEDINKKYPNMVENLELHYKTIERDHLRLITQITKERDSILTKYELLQNDFYQLKHEASVVNDSKNLHFSTFKQTLVNYLSKTIDILEPVLEKDSIERSFRKISFIRDPKNGLDKILQLQTKMESLLKFNEKALGFLTKSYTSFIVNSPILSSSIISNNLNQLPSPLLSPTGSEQGYKLRIKELEKRWSMERETRKIESNIMEQRINKLELENQKLKQQVQTTQRTRY